MYKISISKNTIEIRNQLTNRLYIKISEILGCAVNRDSVLKIQYCNGSYDLYFDQVATLSINDAAFLPVTNFDDFCNIF